MDGRQFTRLFVWMVICLVPLRCGFHAEQALGARPSRTVAVAGYGDIEQVYAADDNGVTIEKVTLYAQERDGMPGTIVRRGILHRRRDAEATILIAHGFMCDKEDVGFLRHVLGRSTYNVMTFDFRAHGQLAGDQCCTFGYEEAHDAIAAASFLREHPDLRGKPLFAYGFSMGAAALIEAAARQEGLFDAMVLDCAFDSSETIIRKNLDNLTVSFLGYEFSMPGKAILQRYAFQPYVQSMIKAALKVVRHLETRDIPLRVDPFAPAESIKKVSAPCFFIHCKNDEKIPANSARNLFNNAAGFKRLWLTNGRRHYDSFFYDPERYASEVHRFYDLVLHNKLADTRDQEVTEDPDDAEDLMRVEIKAREEAA